MEIMKIKVSSQSNPKTVAGSIVHNIREGKQVEATVMGPQAVNQAMKAIIIAGEYIKPEGYDILCRPSFTHLTLDGEEKSAMVFEILANKI